MAMINMNAIQFYDPLSPLRSISTRCAPTLQKHDLPMETLSRKERISVPKLGSLSQKTNRETPSQQGENDLTRNCSIMSDDDDEFPPIDEVIRRSQRQKDFSENCSNSALAAPIYDKVSFFYGSSPSTPTKSGLVDHLNGSEEQPFIIDEDDDDNKNSDLDSTASGGISSNSNADIISQELSPPPSPTVYPNLQSFIPYDLAQYSLTALQNQSMGSQAAQLDDVSVDYEMLEEESGPTLSLIDNKDNEAKKWQQQQDAGEYRVEEAYHVDMDSEDDVEVEENYFQDIKEGTDQQLDTPRRLSPFCDDTPSRRNERRLQYFDKFLSAMQTQQQHQEIYQEKKQNCCENSNIDYKDDQHSDDSEGPQSAKRRRLSPLSSDPTQKQHLRQLYDDSTSKSTPEHYLPMQPLAVLNEDHRQSSIALTSTSVGDQEPLLNAKADYDEWPIYGVFKRLIVEDRVRYSIDFGLKELRTCPQHTAVHQSPNDEDPQAGDLWDIKRIVGMRKINGAKEFLVDWEHTWVADSELGGAKGLVEEFKGQMYARCGRKNGQSKPNATPKREKKKRGRPRKQVL